MTDDDVSRLRARLRDLEPLADALPWRKNRPWRVTTHVWWEYDVPTVDLHDLNVSLATKAMKILAHEASQLETGAFRVITGRGRHSTGPSKMRSAAIGLCKSWQEQHGWSWSSPGSGRLMVVVDPEKAPSVATGQLGWVFWAAAALFIGAFIAFLVRDLWFGG